MNLLNIQSGWWVIADNRSVESLEKGLKALENLGEELGLK